MQRSQRTFLQLLTRSLAVSGLVYALVIAYAVPVTLAGQEADGRLSLGEGARSSLRAEPSWQPSHTRRFRDCVDIERWTSAHVPSTVVVVARDGALRRMSFDEAFRRVTSPSGADDVRTVGACG